MAASTIQEAGCALSWRGTSFWLLCTRRACWFAAAVRQAWKTFLSISRCESTCCSSSSSVGCWEAVALSTHAAVLFGPIELLGASSEPPPLSRSKETEGFNRPRDDSGNSASLFLPGLHTEIASTSTNDGSECVCTVHDNARLALTAHVHQSL